MDRKLLIKLITFLGGLYFFLEYILPEQIMGMKFSAYHEQITQAVATVGVMAFALGLINILKIHGAELVFLKKKWPYSLALLIGLFTMLSLATYDWLQEASTRKATQELRELALFSDFIEKEKDLKIAEQPDYQTRQAILIKEIAKIDFAKFSNLSADTEKAIYNLKNNLNTFSCTELGSALRTIAVKVETAKSAQKKTELGSKLYELVFKGLFVALGSAMFSLLGFYIATAAYRAFRIYSLEAALMMFAALIVMLGQISFGLYISEDLPMIRMWLLTVPNTAAFRAIEIGALVAAIIIAFRMWLSIESESFKEE